MASLEDYIRQGAIKRKINPEYALTTARHEGGLTDPVRQSDVMKNGVREPSYGPFQLLVGGEGTGFPAGLGNDFIRDTGLDPRKPENAFRGIDYALDTIARDGWGRWYGAKAAGLTGMMGVGGNAGPAIAMGAPQGASGVVAPGTIMPPLDAAPSIPAAAPTAVASTDPLGDKIGSAIFGDDLAASLKKTFGSGAPADSTGKQGLGLLGKALGGGSDRQAAADREAATITPSGNLQDDLGSRMQAGTQLMASLLSKRKASRGLSMGS